MGKEGQQGDVGIVRDFDGTLFQSANPMHESHAFEGFVHRTRARGACVCSVYVLAQARACLCRCPSVRPCACAQASRVRVCACVSGWTHVVGNQELRAARARWNGVSTRGSRREREQKQKMGTARRLHALFLGRM
eukprot:2464612-Pleurochrysis_carterae.AAC.1